MSGLPDALRARLTSAEALAQWRPRLFDPGDPAGWEALLALARSDLVRVVHDTLLAQLAELAETRLPRPADAELRPRLAQELLGGLPPERYGRWVLFPWSGALVHVLPEAEYRELRTSRNRYKITAEEQEALRQLRLGVLGLSVGQATAVTLALEEVGGEIRLADFDRLSLSNMNRLRAGAASIGVNKAVLTAREIFEINPYARVRLYPQGLDQTNVDDFLAGGGRLDLLFEECDDLYMKVFVRERARALRIPTLMETSDRGLIDVERFDLEPDRPLLHGLIGEVRAEELRGLPTADKVPFVLDILGTTTLSPRFAATLYEIDRTVRTWPQLASAVALGGALNTDAARRIALGTFRTSGRFHVDIEEQVADGRGVHVSRAPPLPRVATPPHAPAVVTPSRRISEATWRELVRMATLAPSGGNVQPWRFEVSRGRLLVRVEPARADSLLDFERRATYLALGAAAENFCLAAAAGGLRTRVTAFPDPSQPELACEIVLGGSTEGDGPGPEAIAARVTNRRLASPQALSRAQLDAVRAEADRTGARIHLLTDRDALAELGAVLGVGDRLRFVNEQLRRQMAEEMRWSEDEVTGTRDGLDARSLELSATDLAGVRLALSGAGMGLIRALGLGSALEKHAAKSFELCSGALLVSVPGTGAGRYFDGGRALERIWIAAQAAGLAVQPYSAIVYVFLRAESGDTSAFEPAERAALADLRRRYLRLFPVREDESEILLLRLAHAPAPTVRSLRRPLDEVLSLSP